MSIHLGNKRNSLESGFYYIDGRYYSPEIKSFVNSCNISELLYYISIHGGLNLYAIGNPMYFSMNRFNIFTSIPLVPENLGSDNNWNLPEWVKWTVGSIVIAGLWISVPFTGG